MEQVNEYLKQLKDKENNVNKYISEINNIKHKIKEIDKQIEKVSKDADKYIEIAIWNPNIMHIELVSRTVVYDTEESYERSKGDFEYFTDISKITLSNELKKHKEELLVEIQTKESQLKKYIKEN